jgi:hypothetical protein
MTPIKASFQDIELKLGTPTAQPVKCNSLPP